ncbi:O-acetyl-ADP-ribose deacetylase [Spongiibacter taiwanensis]|uniref:O-acetyl-ADP-ribose deacetylase n=1 Tax=Spongiibacter taiwanensis TaxID=1748242 RepID=UPI002035A216|nr:O-acetyl-ADP-ribose deacetylase [Spongiibacter taiwanensis]USA44130.1 O-acetyl-ADP-ribose deacetylase [Spongiibacter taiwanensis]
MSTIRAVQADITTLDVDAIVNAANNSLLGGGGVDGAIHRAAGPELLAYCRGLNGCATGQAKLSPGFKLPAGAVIHTVGPVWQGGDHDEAELLAQCYRNCIAIARQQGFRTVAFSAISCGVYGYPRAAAADIAVSTLRNVLTGSGVDEVLLVAFDSDMLAIWQQAMAANGY